MAEEILDAYKLEQGENIYKLAEELKIQARKVIDFSTPVNPLGISKKVKAEIRKHLKHLHNYPDPEAKRLRRRLAQYHGIDPETILCGNGSIELIYLITRTLKPQKVLIPAPTFSEYERAVKTVNRDREQLSVKEELFDKTHNTEDNPYLIILRAMTNFYALSGLRIGYGVFPQHLIGRLKEYKEPWTVNSLAQRAAVVAIKD